MAEIRRAPLEVGRLSHYLQGFIPPNGGAVVQDFFPSITSWVEKTSIFKTLTFVAFWSELSFRETLEKTTQPEPSKA